MTFIVVSTILFRLLDSLWGPAINKLGHFDTLVAVLQLILLLISKRIIFFTK